MSRRPFVLEFSARKAGALGVFYNCVAIREAETLEAATLALYTEYEHISGCHESTRYGVRDGRLYSLRADHADPTAP